MYVLVQEVIQGNFIPLDHVETCSYFIITISPHIFADKAHVMAIVGLSTLSQVSKTDPGDILAAVRCELGSRGARVKLNIHMWNQLTV